MKIRTIWFVVAAAVLALQFAHPLLAHAQEPVESAQLRGHLSHGSGVWRADDFGWFYYDMDKGQGGEELRIDMQGRVAEKGHIVYSSRVWPRQFEYEPWGSYQAVAFLSKPYLAGYPESDFTSEASSLSKGALRRVLIDTTNTYILTYNTSMPLMSGYVLAISEISKKNNAVNFVLLKNGKPVHAAIVSIGGTYSYKIGGVPIILVHLANAMCDENFGSAEVDGIFQISDEPSVKLFEGGRLGNLKLTDLSEDFIEFRNDKSLTLIKNSEVSLVEGFVLRVTDSTELIYYPEGGIYDYGVHEIRGPAFSGRQVIPGTYGGKYPTNLTARWNSGNYSIYYMDPEKQLGSENQFGFDDKFGSETLSLYSVNGRTILPPTGPKILNGTVILNGFQYTTTMRSKEYEFKPWGDYYVIPFLGDLWFAGYDRTTDNEKASLNLLDHEKIGRVLIDSEVVRGNIVAGTYSLQEGYEVQIRDVEKDKIYVQILKNKILLDSSVVKSNSTYIYKKDLDDVKDMPIIKIHVNNIFSNGSIRFATIDGIFQISDQFLLPVEPGLGIGKLQIMHTPQPYAIIMVNDETINLNRDSTIALAPNMYLRVADNDTLRYYIYSNKYVVPRPRPPQFIYPDNVASSTPINFSMNVQAAEILGVKAEILDSNNRTVWSKDITDLRSGSGEFWRFSWRWNATTLQLSDNKSLVRDANGGPEVGLLYLNASSSPVQVAVKFDQSGRITSIFGSNFIYYVSPDEYSSLNATQSYDSMLANDTIRNQYIKIEPGKSNIQFLDVINGRLVPSGINHTLKGTLAALEPHTIVVGAKPGRYDLRVRVENAVNAIQTFGEYFNVIRAEMRSVTLGSARVFAKETATIPLEAPRTGGEKRINISYDASRLKATGISGACNPTWQVDQNTGSLSVLLPKGCGSANLNFTANQPINANATIELLITGTSGFKPETISNGTITIAAEQIATKKGNALGFFASLFALALGFCACRRALE